MKVFFGNGITAYSGKFDQVVYEMWFKGLLCLARQFRLPTATVQNAKIGSIGNHIKQLYKEADPLFVQDFKTYSALNKKEHAPKYVEKAKPMPGSMALFSHCMWEWQKTYPTHIDLETVTITDMVSMGSPACSVKKSVIAGYLREVTDYESLDHPIDGA